MRLTGEQTGIRHRHTTRSIAKRYASSETSGYERDLYAARRDKPLVYDLPCMAKETPTQHSVQKSARKHQ